jgi:phosphatidylinositol alpha-1,6-mannosyltransferase
MFNQTTQNDPQMLWQLKRTGARSYLFVYGADIGFIRRPRGWIMHYLSFLMAQRVITISRSSEERLQQKFPFVKTDIVMPGIRQEPQHGEPLSERRGIVSVGRLVERKGHDTLLRAVRRLKDQGIDGNTTIIGEGPERTHLVQLVKQLGLDSEVTFMRGVDDEGVREALRKHRVFCQLPRVLPNGDVEGFGIVFLEAASQGLPVVAGASGGVPDAVSDGVGGYLVNPTDIDDVAEHLQTLLSDDICWQEMSAGAVAWAERFWWDSRRVQDEFPFLRMGR